ncbi:type II toxin-antitoxin system YafQ family toxin [Treponema berlinense]|uniref:type II toxin-antitoxin system YafQ family toxin n=1 Tax=Treponema berlinense TaxID=225004 RepID=UPI0026F144DF|nr:type II toxin-antitoxin system YafQ family toxin [Treponema berlinense]
MPKMRKLKTTSSFRTDLKKLTKSEADETKSVVVKLQKDETLDAKYRDHDLHGNYNGYRECHIRPDLLSFSPHFTR